MDRYRYLAPVAESVSRPLVAESRHSEYCFLIALTTMRITTEAGCITPGSRRWGNIGEIGLLMIQSGRAARNRLVALNYT